MTVGDTFARDYRVRLRFCGLHLFWFLIFKIVIALDEEGTRFQFLASVAHINSFTFQVCFRFRRTIRWTAQLLFHYIALIVIVLRTLCRNIFQWNCKSVPTRILFARIVNRIMTVADR